MAAGRMGFRDTKVKTPMAALRMGQATPDEFYARHDSQKGRPKPTVKLTSSFEKPTSARNIAVRSRLKRSPIP
jgi:hypothetical protein